MSNHDQEKTSRPRLIVAREESGIRGFLRALLEQAPVSRATANQQSTAKEIERLAQLEATLLSDFSDLLEARRSRPTRAITRTKRLTRSH